MADGAVGNEHPRLLEPTSRPESVSTGLGSDVIAVILSVRGPG